VMRVSRETRNPGKLRVSRETSRLYVFPPIGISP
jgi:hypothetical protein